MLKPKRLPFREHAKRIVRDAHEEKQVSAQLFIEKPFRPKRLVRKISAFLKKEEIRGLLIFEVETGITEAQFMPVLNAILKRANIPPNELTIHVLFDVAKKDIKKAIDKRKT